VQLGAKGVLLFPVVPSHKKDPLGEESANPEGLIPKSIQAIKQHFPNLVVFADVALDPYTTHGHDGILSPDQKILNDPTIAQLCKQALCLAKAQVDFIAPSDMMDGRVGALRSTLDTAGYSDVGILAYTAKYSSAFYGPFRIALQSGARGLDKKSYQMPYTTGAREALLEAHLDIEEGADMLMVKPGTLYLDILSQISQHSPLPTVAYHVSGEYAMLKAAVPV
jgi:porphobilinogen synthase